MTELPQADIMKLRTDPLRLRDWPEPEIGWPPVSNACAKFTQKKPPTPGRTTSVVNWLREIWSAMLRAANTASIWHAERLGYYWENQVELSGITSRVCIHSFSLSHENANARNQASA